LTFGLATGRARGKMLTAPQASQQPNCENPGREVIQENFKGQGGFKE